jgi:hypothetical protein
MLMPLTLKFRGILANVRASTPKLRQILAKLRPPKPKLRAFTPRLPLKSASAIAELAKMELQLPPI